MDINHTEDSQEKGLQKTGYLHCFGRAWKWWTINILQGRYSQTTTQKHHDNKIAKIQYMYMYHLMFDDNIIIDAIWNLLTKHSFNIII